ncbi:ca6f2446-00a9-445c-8593-ebfeaf4f46e4 [Thermothielavioides terrestris]|uniref:Ca6f2446-00a9-445c-8593-ebfeaf4f46e4 n=1 Tax=Thermothielavioides terrestris TaxID=2587410 RepID=A0A446BFS4_9PEZI|nr:ca6f2446-00a9-445c-8593-ebfeaf4f46e4 [Thermothielavioides terrestris]
MPSPSENGAIKRQGPRVKYVSAAHWAAILDGIAELKDHLEQQDEYQAPASEQCDGDARPSGPLLLYGGWSRNLTRSFILESLPERPVVDRLVSRYFNTVVVASCFPHSGKFRREYDEFWKAPQQTPIMWIGLLFAMMCLSAQTQQFYTAQTSNSSEVLRSIHAFKEKVVQCLVLGEYTSGGPYVVETLLLYLMTEFFPSRDMQVGTRLLVGTIVQIAMHMGYHRDSSHFPTISPFEGEMRRRVWALIYQIDFGTSTQMGLPRLLIRESQIDAAEPRNLADADFDEHSAELPPSRPDTDVTPALYSAAKLRIFSVGVKVADLASEIRCPAYADVLDLDRQLDVASDSLPSTMKWTGLASCLTESSQVILQRIFLRVCVYRMKITLHKRFLSLERSRVACLTAAMEILKLQHLLDEESQPDGRLYQSRWRVTSAFTHDFLVATSILCLYLRTLSSGEDKGDDATEQSMEEMKTLLRLSQAIWLRESATSKEAQKAAEALRYVLGDNFFDMPGPILDFGSDGLAWQMLGTNMNLDGTDMWAGFGA